jgi:hypothetical protein
MAALHYEFVVLPDGAKLAYEILGSQFLGVIEPLVWIPGMTNIRSDFERITAVLSESRPGMSLSSIYIMVVVDLLH